ncbi:TniQ family protein [Cohnella lupini]|uniref:TniQ protein n=1 Tax=Cohnella lupini TaxID=1294267 RepID=A0A3D9HU07_9BACL|nr:TniQ family protein [Cohnella lupini]RED52900.1 TniQ protein [Cohnella lupini]
MLLIRPKPQDGESMIGYLYRLTEENGYPSVSQVKHLIQADKRELERNLLNERSISRLGQYTGYNEIELVNMTSQDLRVLIHGHQYNQLILRQRVQYCPLCVQEMPVHRKSWCLSAINICPVHHIWLQSGCICGQIINLHSIIKGYCMYCETRMQQFSNENDPDKHLIDLQYELSRLFVTSSKKIHILSQEIGVAEFLAVVKHSLSLLHDIPSCISEGTQIRDLTSKGKHSYKSCLSYFEVIEMYRDFPNRFIRVLKEQKSKTPSAQTIAKYNFEKLLLDPTWHQLKQVYSNFMKDAKPNWNVRATPSMLNISSYQYLSKTAASHFLGVAKETVNKMARIGILHEKDIGFEKKVALDEIQRLLIKCKGDQKNCTGRISLRDIVQMYPKRGLDVTGIIKLVVDGVLQTASELTCDSLMNVTFDRSEIDYCFEVAFVCLSLRGENKMKNALLNEFQMRLASVTGQGIVFNGNVYTNVRMVSNQWFEAAEKNGEWFIPVLYKPENPDFLLLYDMDGLEVASAVDAHEEMDKEIVNAYLETINDLKDRIIKRKDS